MRYDSTLKIYVKDTEKSSVTFDIDSDGTLSLTDQSELLALGDKNGNWLKPNPMPELRSPVGNIIRDLQPGQYQSYIAAR